MTSFNCFYCCKTVDNIKIEHDKQINIALQGHSCVDNCEIKSRLTSNQIKKNLSQISHYLQEPKLIPTEIQGTLELIRICRECKEICEKLGDLCSLLEVTQMKINYYLNLLTDQILKKHEIIDHQQIIVSEYQEKFHKSCLTKLAQIATNPVLKLTKCKIPEKSVQQLFHNEDTDNFDDYLPSDAEEDPNLETNLNPSDLNLSGSQTTPKFSCKYCPLTFVHPWNKKKHMLAVHLKPDLYKSNGSALKYHVIKPCEYCGAMVSTRNLSRHKRISHGVTFTTTMVKCRKCGKMVERLKMKKHLEENKKCGLVQKFRCPNCNKNFTKKDNLQRHLKNVCETTVDASQVKIEVEMTSSLTSDSQKTAENFIPNIPKPVRSSAKVARIFSCEYCPFTFTTNRHKKSHELAVHLKKPINKTGSHVIKPCDICGAMISSRNLSAHKKLHHGYNSGINKRRKIVKFKRCEICRKMFETGWKMREHLRESKECGDKAEFKCTKCGKIFSRKCNLQRHLDEVCETRKDVSPVKIELEFVNG